MEINFSRASAFAEVIELLDPVRLESNIKQMRKQMSQPDKNFHIGGANVETSTITK